MFTLKEVLENFRIVFFSGRSSVSLEILTPPELQLELTGTSGRRDQSAKEVSCYRPTWPVLRLYSRCKCVHTCVLKHCRVSSEGQTTREK